MRISTLPIQPLSPNDLTSTDGITLLKTFGITVGENRNRFSVSEEGLKSASTFIGRPGVLYKECSVGKCEYSHPNEGTPCKRALTAQKPYEVSEIINVEEKDSVAYFTHKINNTEGGEELIQLINDRVVKYVSPSFCGIPRITDELNIWGEPLEIYDKFYGVHLAFVSTPAYGEQAGLIASCTDGECVNFSEIKFTP